MELQTSEHTDAPAAGALSVSLSEKKHSPVKRVKDSVKDHEDLWQEITDDLAKDSAPVWRMWR